MKLNPMSEPPKDNREVLIVDADKDFYFGEYREEASTWHVDTTGQWQPLRHSHVEPIGWVDLPAIDIEETGT